MPSPKKPVRTFPKRRGAVKPDSRTWCMTIQGGHTKLTSHENEYEDRPGGKRGKVLDFSDASRLRILQLTEEINWRAMGKSVFLTMTLPDGSWNKWQPRLTDLRHRFMRATEKHLKRKIPILWRIEWLPRESGRYVGEMRPHWHMMMPGVRWYDQIEATELLRPILKHGGCINLKVERIESKRQAAVYIAKYVAKKSVPSSLDYVAYLSTEGRHWGVHQKALLVMHPRKSFEDLPLEAVNEIRKVMEEHRPSYSSVYDAGFSSFGPRQKDVNAIIKKIAVDSGSEVE